MSTTLARLRAPFLLLARRGRLQLVSVPVDVACCVIDLYFVFFSSDLELLLGDLHVSDYADRPQEGEAH